MAGLGLGRCVVNSWALIGMVLVNRSEQERWLSDKFCHQMTGNDSEFIVLICRVRRGGSFS